MEEELRELHSQTDSGRLHSIIVVIIIIATLLKLVVTGALQCVSIGTTV